MKMSDVLGWDAILPRYGHCESFTLNGVIRNGDFYGFLFSSEEAAGAVSHAVVNHDRLVDALVAITSDYVQLANSGDAGCWSAEDVEAIVYARKLLKELGHEI